MTEQEWLTSEDPRRMMDYLRGAHLSRPEVFGYPKINDRQSRLFCCGCCRQSPLNNTSQRAVEVSERFADSLVNDDALSYAWANSGLPWSSQSVVCWAHKYTQRMTTHFSGGVPTSQPTITELPEPCIRANLLRDILGNPWRPVNITDSEVCWVTPTVLHLAQHIYNEHAFDLMPYLADALDEAGCQHQSITDHCRAVCLYCKDAKFDTGDHGGPLLSGTKTAKWLNSQCVCGGTRLATHVRGCWVLDLILGKN